LFNRHHLPPFRAFYPTDDVYYITEILALQVVRILGCSSSFIYDPINYIRLEILAGRKNIHEG